ncbi:hypothetical protein ACFVZR_02265 [Streptomyces sp. NPDC058316]|uniref:hypothetical protein n=1 Tax=Streptomyces sp. NPDC058316 TaxID=3346442 RepID=UPI0036E1B96C
MQTGYAGWPIPSGGDAPVGPGQLAAIAAAIDPHLQQHAVDLADRNERYAGAPARTLVTAANGATWVKVSSTANTWVTLWEPEPAWKPLPLASGMSPGGNTPEYKIVGRQVHMRGRVVRSDDTLLVGNSQALAPTPPDARPKQLCSWAGGQSLTGDPVTGVCRIECATSVVWWSQDGSGSPWVDISGSYWLD